MGVEVALQWCSDTFSDLVVGFVNSVKTIDGGTHIEGFKVCFYMAKISLVSVMTAYTFREQEKSRHLGSCTAEPVILPAWQCNVLLLVREQAGFWCL